MNDKEVRNLIQKARQFSKPFRVADMNLHDPKLTDAKLKELAAA